jgi:hypothetical protein
MCSISSLVSRKIPKRLLSTPTTPTRLINESKQCLAIPANIKYLNVATNVFFLHYLVLLLFSHTSRDQATYGTHLAKMAKNARCYKSHKLD